MPVIMSGLLRLFRRRTCALSPAVSGLEPPVPALPKRAGPEVICNLCASNGNECEIPLDKVTSRCESTRTVCERCMERHILQCVEKSHFAISCVCVSRGCSQVLGFEDVRKYASKELFSRYDQGLLHSVLERNPEFCWCARAGCGSGQLHIRRAQHPVMRCHACSFKTCFTHHCEWHQGRTCREYDTDARRSDEVGLLQLLQNKARFQTCPACHNGVEKRGGCDHMTCRCKHEFCWRCLAPYLGENGIRAKGRRAHGSSCLHYQIQVDCSAT
jgi:hypothetical protein